MRTLLCAIGVCLSIAACGEPTPDPVPYLVRDIRVGAGSGRRSDGNVAELNGALLFAADDGEHGVELWKAGGGAAGAVFLKDIRPGNESSSIWLRGAPDFRGVVYFAANDGEHGTELWRTDGTPDGTFMLRDLCPGSCASRPGAYYDSGDLHFVEAFGYLYFGARSPAGTTALWRTDGSAEGTQIATATLGDKPIFEIGPFAFLSDGIISYVMTEQRACASCYHPGTEVWRTDREASTQITSRLPTLPSTRNHAYVDRLGELEGALYLLAGWDLLRMDGTPEGTTKVASVHRASWEPVNPAMMAGRLYFSGERSLWRSDGTSAGTESFLPFCDARLAVVDDALFLTGGCDPNGVGWELWKTDGTAQGTTLLKDINPGSGGSDPHFLGSRSGVVYFHAADSDGECGAQLWRSDGTTIGTRRLALLSPRLDCGTAQERSISLVAAVGSYLYMDIDDGVHGKELWALPMP